jgi:hypothetical protein
MVTLPADTASSDPSAYPLIVMVAGDRTDCRLIFA